MEGKARPPTQFYGRLAQPAEHLFYTQEVEGSNPSSATQSHGAWRSPAARAVRDREAEGSNPSAPTLKG